MTDRDLGATLLAIARSAIAVRLGLPALEWASHDALKERAATFVTLTESGQLRGCIGTLAAVRALEEDVRENAIAAAFHDPRFAPLAASEFHAVEVEVSVLSESERMDVVDESDLRTRLRPGVDGLILEFGSHRATFLPQVWETLPAPRAFLAALKHKAGLPRGFWSPQVMVSRYGVTKYAEGARALGDVRR